MPTRSGVDQSDKIDDDRSLKVQLKRNIHFSGVRKNVVSTTAEIPIDCSLLKTEITTVFTRQQKCNPQTVLKYDYGRIPCEQWTSEQ